ncbi:hypothetical protein [Inhella proteolytica]|uniref:Transmembrane protein n=1 Tax=Inhella proteolytica TaxID=2795029 RepID=A0A931J5F7_9BURK|nr:hypothetical protein [Inhella proteolytica]MBH9578606.1 hypothetical protein [Inhella proteolytica]
MGESLQRLLKLSSLLIAVCLFLPLQSCTLKGKEEVFFPLSGDPSQWWMVLAVYLPPLLVWWRRLPMIWRLIASIASCTAGLYAVSFLTFALQWKGKLLLGWYVYTGASAIHLSSSLALAWMNWRARRSARRSTG